MIRIFKPSESNFQELAPFQNFRLETVMPRLGGRANSNHIMFDLRRLNPGHYSFPYHFHHNAEELFVIFSGTATLRTPDGFQKVEQGDLVFFGMGENSAHQLFNHSDEPCVYLDIRTTREMDFTEYPDSGKVTVFPFHKVFEKDSEVDYFHGEENVDRYWEQE
ncbi:MAG TPA: cupin domain-containing protein [Sunxiuqinia sp.]|nr:cupin domain-containing protein [Sunxiuqinia sp.]